MIKLFRNFWCCQSSNTHIVAPSREKSNLIACGAHGKVYKELINGKLYACKKFDKKEIYSKEVRILKNLKNSKYLQKYKYSNNSDLIIYSKYISGNDLFYYLENKSILEKNPMPTLNDKKIKKIGLGVVNALIELNKFGFVHLDLKLENIIVDKYLNITLIDFDTSQYLFSNNSLNVLHGFVGTTNYAAPEIFCKYYTKNSDVWSLGIILWMLKTGTYPYYIRNDHSNREILVDDINSFNSYEIINEYDIYLDLVTKMLKKNPNDRISVEEIKNHPYFT